MELSWIHFLFVCPLVFLASFVDAIGGGGGLISLPAYLMAGLPIHNAVATNKLSSASGTVISTVRLVRHKYADKKAAPFSIAAALLGSSIGAAIALHTGEEILEKVLLVVLPLTAFYVLKNKNMEPSKPFSLKISVEYAIITAASFVIGIYDGFYGPGTGTFLLLAFTGLARMDVKTASGNMKIVNLSSNAAALAAFIFAGKIIWSLGLCASVCSMLGHYFGSGLVIENGTKIVKPVIAGVLILFFIRILVQ